MQHRKGLRKLKRESTKASRTIAPPAVQVREAQRRARVKQNAELQELKKKQVRKLRADDARAQVEAQAGAQAALERAVAQLRCDEEAPQEPLFDPPQQRAFARPSARASASASAQSRASAKQVELLEMSRWAGRHTAGEAVLHSMSAIADAVHEAVMLDGALVLSEGGTGTPRVVEKGASSFLNSLTVQELLIQINVDARACLKKRPSESQGQEIASGELNAIVKYAATSFDEATRSVLGIPQGVPFAVRVAREGISAGAGCEFMPRAVAIQEFSIAAFASANNVGVPLYAASVHPERVALGGYRTLVGSTMIMSLADRDARASFDVVGVVALLQRVSQIGLLLFDLKPANLLEIRPPGSAVCECRVADFDAAYSVVCSKEEAEDWRAILLMHLSLYAAHVANAYAPTRNGVARTWMAEMRYSIGVVCSTLGLEPDAAVGEHASSRWLLAARASAVKAEPVARALNSSFARWRTLNVICTHYFYKPKVYGNMQLPRSAQWNLWALSLATPSREAATFGASVIGRLIAFVDWWLEQSALSGR
jgi:hypothetical protein